MHGVCIHMFQHTRHVPPTSAWVIFITRQDGRDRVSRTSPKCLHSNEVRGDTLPHGGTRANAHDPSLLLTLLRLVAQSRPVRRRCHARARMRRRCSVTERRLAGCRTGPRTSGLTCRTDVAEFIVTFFRRFAEPWRFSCKRGAAPIRKLARRSGSPKPGVAATSR